MKNIWKIFVLFFSVFLLTGCSIVSNKKPIEFNVISEQYISWIYDLVDALWDNLTWTAFNHNSQINVSTKSSFLNWYINLTLTGKTNSDIHEENLMEMNINMSWNMDIPFASNVEKLALTWVSKFQYFSWDWYFKLESMVLDSSNPKLSMIGAMLNNLVWKQVKLDSNDLSIKSYIWLIFDSKTDQILKTLSQLKSQKIFINSKQYQKNWDFYYDVELNKEILANVIIENYSKDDPTLSAYIKNFFDQIKFNWSLITSDWKNISLYISWLQFSDLFNISWTLWSKKWSLLMNPMQNLSSKLSLNYIVKWSEIDYSISILEWKTETLKLVWTVSVNKQLQNYNIKIKSNIESSDISFNFDFNSIKSIWQPFEVDIGTWYIMLNDLIKEFWLSPRVESLTWDTK